VGAPTQSDRVRDEWFPVCPVGDLGPNSCLGFEMLGERYLLAVGADGRVLAARDTCPHRGARLTLGRFVEDTLICGYHGWQYGLDGRCTAIPSQPDARMSANRGLATLRVQTAYGFYWVCEGPEPRELPSYPQYDVAPTRNTICGPRTVLSTGPRIVENFLDLAHFPFVHPETLGDPGMTEVGAYKVTSSDHEVRATGCEVWQPAPAPGSVGGKVLYTYSVTTAYSAVLEKLPDDPSEAFALLLLMRPEDEERCRCWMVGSVYGSDGPLEEFDKFTLFIFEQDIPIVESQLPKRLPLDPRAELQCTADRTSIAYRKWLRERGISYGTSDNDPAASVGSSSTRSGGSNGSA
jgi:phenylpropionate dioxygenase-like ring-hydroxylating dioxygenase large terminal subunit